MLEGLLYLPSPALEEAPSVDEREGCGSDPCGVVRSGLRLPLGRLEGHAARRRV
jgi:hypothetical protein